MAADKQNSHNNSTAEDEEFSPLLENQELLKDEMESFKPESCESKESPPFSPTCKLSAAPEVPGKAEWTADGVPLGVVGEAVGRTPWVTGVSHCLGRQDEFFSSDLQGTFESLASTHGCCQSILEDDVQREQCEAACDFAVHVFCHPCALCQEGREIRRRVPHPGFNAQPILAMIPPTEQSMGPCHDRRTSVLPRI